MFMFNKTYSINKVCMLIPYLHLSVCNCGQNIIKLATGWSPLYPDNVPVTLNQDADIEVSV